MNAIETLPGLPDGVKPYDWALEQLRVKQAHKITRGSKDVIVALIDLGYNHHPDMEGHLWNNPNPAKGDVHGWDCADNDASLAYSGAFVPSRNYYYGHHVFVAGEVAAMAPECPVMIVRIGLDNPGSWADAIHYAVDNGAQVLVMPHSYLTGVAENGIGRFYQGTDFCYPVDNPQLHRAYDDAYNNGCIIVRGAADNRGRRVVTATSAHEAVLSVGSTNRRDQAADICCSSDYTEVGTPGGERHSADEKDRIWGCGPDSNYIPFTGGCMASGFGGGAAALIWSRFPQLTNDQVRQILRNTARPGKNVSPDMDGWEPKLGYGIVDVHRAVSLTDQELCRNVQLDPASVEVVEDEGALTVRARVTNLGVFDARKAIVVAYNGDPSKPADPEATRKNPAPLLQTKQIGHTIVRVRGLHEAAISIDLIEQPKDAIWFETFCLDLHDAGHVHHAVSR